MPEAYLRSRSHPAAAARPMARSTRSPRWRSPTAPLQALKERNNLAEDVVDDVVLGVVDPVGEAGSDIARFAALKAGLGERTGRADRPFLRFRPRRRELRRRPDHGRPA